MTENIDLRIPDRDDLAPRRHGRAVSQNAAPRRHYRSLFMSDLHLGARGCRPDLILEFLDRNSADVLYLVGDIFDTWQPMSGHWSPMHDAVVQTLMARAQDGVRIVYLPGNHDEFFRRHYGTYFGNIEVVEQAFHVAADGLRYLVLHGDSCDMFMRRARWLSRLGSHIDSGLRGVNALINRGRRVLGLDALSAIEIAISRVNGLIRHGDGFERRLAALARNQNQDGVICGHFHKAALHEDFGVVYANCGDWIDSFTAIAEESDGRLKLVQCERRMAVAPAQDILAEADDAPTLAI